MLFNNIKSKDKKRTMKFETANVKYKLEIIINYMAVPRHSIIDSHIFSKMRFLYKSKSLNHQLIYLKKKRGGKESIP